VTTCSSTCCFLLDYTAGERQNWYEWLGQHGEQVLKISAGPGGDGRFETLGDLVRHIFSAEKRSMERLSGRPLTDTASVGNDNIEALFPFGEQSRKEFQEFVAAFPAEDWNVPNHCKIMNYALRAPPKKIVMHTLMHETRHWAQIATLLRWNGLMSELHDFIARPLMGGEFGPR
jgi:uncharacterized damage-inducible protein DinB